MHKIILGIIFLLVIIHTKTFAQENKNRLENLLQKDTSKILKKILENPQKYYVQILYTQIDRDKNNNPTFKEYNFRLNKDEYFYPASTVKMPIALLALEKINDLNIKGLSKSTTMITESSTNANIESVLTNPKSCDGRPSIEEYIKEIFLVSDNDAFNRLYEFLGQEYMLKKLHQKGYNSAIIRHRLNTARTIEQNKYTNGISFYDSLHTLLYKQLEKYSQAQFDSFNAYMGKGYYQNDSLINRPLDFSKKNRFSLEDLTHILRSVIFYDQTPENERFHLTKDDRDFVMHYMQADPTKNYCPNYDTTNYYPNYCKFLYYGAKKEAPDKNLLIYNKVGDAYGFLIDIAYIIDTAQKIEFMLSATIYCNQDEILNDNQYDYETLGFPFMEHLGKLIYNYERKRNKKYLPIFADFKKQ